MLLDAIDVGGDVVHDDVQLSVFCIWLLQLFAFSGPFTIQLDEVGVAHAHHVLVVHLFMNLQLAALVPLVLLQLLHRHYFPSRLQRAHKHFRERAHPALYLLRELILLL